MKTIKRIEELHRRIEGCWSHISECKKKINSIYDRLEADCPQGLGKTLSSEQVNFRKFVYNDIEEAEKKIETLEEQIKILKSSTAYSLEAMEIGQELQIKYGLIAIRVHNGWLYVYNHNESISSTFVPEKI